MAVSFTINKRVLVTGGGKGIGRDLCKKLVACGAKVVSVSRTKADLDSLVAECPGVSTVHLDIAADWYQTSSVIESLGVFDCLVNNAGVAISSPFLDIKPEEIDKQFDVNVKAVINVSQIVAKAMIRNGNGGCIVNISSQASMAALKGHSVYSSTKGALDALTRVMALELGPHKIRVNCINPTVVMTDMGRYAWSEPTKAGEMLSKIPLGRFAEIDEVVNTVLFLLSDAAPIINGVTLPIDGGFLAC